MMVSHFKLQLPTFNYFHLNFQVCLQQDDIEALQTLYPDCELRIARPICYKTQHNIGWVRILVYILLPTLACVVAIVVLGQLCQRHQRRRLRAANSLVQSVTIRVEGLERENLRLSSTLEQRETAETERVDSRARSLSKRILALYHARGPNSPRPQQSADGTLVLQPRASSGFFYLQRLASKMPFSPRGEPSSPCGEAFPAPGSPSPVPSGRQSSRRSGSRTSGAAEPLEAGGRAESATFETKKEFPLTHTADDKESPLTHSADDDIGVAEGATPPIISTSVRSSAGAMSSTSRSSTGAILLSDHRSSHLLAPRIVPTCEGSSRPSAGSGDRSPMKSMRGSLLSMRSSEAPPSPPKRVSSRGSFS